MEINATKLNSIAIIILSLSVIILTMSTLENKPAKKEITYPFTVEEYMNWVNEDIAKAEELLAQQE